MYTIGVDIGGTNIRAGIFDGTTLIGYAHTPTRSGSGTSAVLEDVFSCIENALMFTGTDISECDGIGVGCPGLCDRENGVVLSAHNLGWERFELSRPISERYGLPCRIANDADCAALAEYAAGAGCGAHSLLMITLGTGVGSGYIVGGRITGGWHSLGGELGHMCICMDGEMCSCGERGCLEAYASASALVRQARRAGAENPDSALACAEVRDAETVFRLAADGDAAAHVVVERYCRYVAVGVTGAVNLLYPETVVLGGGVARSGEALAAPVREYVRRHRFAAATGVLPKITASALDGSAGMLGAAALMHEPDGDRKL